VLLKRIITATIAIPLVTALIYWGSDKLFLLMVILTAGLSLLEFYKMNFNGTKFASIPALIVGSASIILIYYYQDKLSFNTAAGVGRYISWIIILITVIVVLFLVIQLILFPKNIIFTNNLIIISVGIVYVCLFLSYLVLLRRLPDGKDWIFLTLLLVWSADIGAYIAGKMLGAHKLCPLISPKKTIEGALGGMAAAVATAYFARLCFFKELPLAHCVILALGIAVIGQVGDLCESTFKRMGDIKDSGNLLPGHGGMLDRIDSLLFAAPFVYYYNMLIL
jgi:phosphatidate cytidylyltransferase